MKRILTLSTILALCSLQAFAWSVTGHRIIAEIAQRNLSPKAQEAINKILDNQCMAYYANWPDFIKSDTTGRWKHTHKWHYVNAPTGMQKDAYLEYIKLATTENVYSEIKNLSKALAKGGKKQTQQENLMFLIHLVGDMHQPMHAGQYSDLGGNKITVFWFERETNLHSVWDNSLVDFNKYSYTEYANILNVMTDEQRESLQAGQLEDWLFESYSIAGDIYARTPDGSKLGFNYNYIYNATIEKQLQRAGMRLAKLLNDIYR